MLDNKWDENHIVEQLFKKKLVECKKGKSDRGQKDVLITKMGLELPRKMAVRKKHEDAILYNLNKRKLKLLNELLEKIRDK